MTNPIAARMKAGRLPTSSPAWQIVTKAKLTPADQGSGRLFTESDSAALKKLMKSFFDYGRKNWDWISSSSTAGADGGLVLGKTKACACATFNLNFKWLAESVLDIDGIALGQYTKHFVTIPGKHCIDKNWAGNVLSPKGELLPCYKFSQHYWVTHSGQGYDVCFNSTFSGTSFIGLKLGAADGPALQRTGLTNLSLFKLQKPEAGADYVAMVKKADASGWPVWQLFAEEDLPAKDG
jgi:hypothetical protein